MRKPSRLSHRLSKSSSSKESHSHMMREIQSYYETISESGVIDSKYEGVIPASEEAYRLLSVYLATGSCKHLETTSQSILLMNLIKKYGLCRDKITTQVIDKLKSQMNSKDAIRIIESVGSVNEENRFVPGEPYFVDFAIQNAWDIIGASLVTSHPHIAGLLLERLAEATQPPPEVVLEEEEEED